MKCEMALNDLSYLIVNIAMARGKSARHPLRLSKATLSHLFLDSLIRIGIVCALIVLTFMHAGCAARKTLTKPPEAPPPMLQSAADAFDLLLRNHSGTNSMKASGKIEMKLPGETHRRQASIIIMLQRPDKLRMRAYRPLSPTLFELVSNGDECWLFVPSRNAAYLSEGCKPFRVSNGDTAISTELFFAALFVLVDPEILSSQQASITTGEDLIGLKLTEETGGRREIWIDPATGLAARQMLMNPDGSIRADLKYLDYAKEEAMTVPVRVEAVMPQMEAEVTLRINQFDIHAEIPDGAFIFLPPEGNDIISVGDGSPLTNSLQN
jgi:outer membrane lipoprotein-sorting protein